MVGLALVGEQYPVPGAFWGPGFPNCCCCPARRGRRRHRLLAAGPADQDSRPMGWSLTEIASLADHREALLHSISEGVLGVGPAGQVTVVNDGARELLDLPADCVGRDVADLGLEPDLLDVVLGRPHGHRPAGVASRPVLVVNRRTARTGGAVRCCLRNGHHAARPVRTDCRAATTRRHQKRHRYPAGADPRIRQPTARHLGIAAAQRIQDEVRDYVVGADPAPGRAGFGDDRPDRGPAAGGVVGREVQPGRGIAGAS